MRTTSKVGMALVLCTLACNTQRGDGSGAGIQGGDDGSDGGGDDSGDGGDDDGDGGDDDGDGDGTPKFDVGGMPDAGDGDGCGGDGDSPFSNIWIANSTEGTVSKIDTRTGIETGRYWTHPGMSGLSSPSRTSVNLLGDVAVSNRNAPSTTKIAAHEERCVDSNGNGAIDTSTGPGDVRPWGEDECVIWHTAFPDCPGDTRGPRPTQWEGKRNATNPCEPDDNPRLWVAYLSDEVGTGQFKRLDGATGAVLDSVSYPGLATSYGAYGGVVNADGDLFVNGLDIGQLVKVDAVTLDVSDYGNPGVSFYGIGIDADGNPWIAGGDDVAVWDDTLQTWDVIPTQNGILRGIQIDRAGTAWAAGNSPCGLVELDVATRTVRNEHVALDGCNIPVGVSIDVDGYVWSPDMGMGTAYKVDPDTRLVALVVDGLVGPYTYSDMTGAGLDLVTNPPG